MAQALTGFITIAVVIGLGAMLAHLRVLDLAAQQILLRLAFFVASPALMLTTVGDADLGQALGQNLLATSAAVILGGSVYLVAARAMWRRTAGEATIGVLSSVYCNAGNLGIPVAAYALGDASLVAPTLLLQMLVLQPIALIVLDRDRRGAAGATSSRPVLQAIAQPLTNPLTLASLAGVALALSGWQLPTVVRDPIVLVGHMAVPMMLIGYGVALRLGPGLAAGGTRAELAVVTLVKIVVVPVAAWAVAHLVMGLDGAPLLAVVVTASLPTAQNIFVHAVRYDRSTTLARDSILVTTALSPLAVLTWVALLS